MHDAAIAKIQTNMGYHGLRMSADAFLALTEDPTARYELIDGVICMSPSPIFRHQAILAEISGQLREFLVRRPIGLLAVEVDVRLKDDLVYRPDLVFLSKEKADRCQRYITEAPDFIIEILSPGSRRMDQETKRGDYEHAGVGEYWLFDPDSFDVTKLVLQQDRFVEVSSTDGKHVSITLPGFTLDIDRLHTLFPTKPSP